MIKREREGNKIFKMNEYILSKKKKGFTAKFGEEGTTWDFLRNKQID